MQHVKQCLEGNAILKRLKSQTQDNQCREVLALLSEQQRQEVISVRRSQKGCVVKLRSAYALYGIKQALKNFYMPVKVFVSPGP